MLDSTIEVSLIPVIVLGQTLQGLRVVSDGFFHLIQARLNKPSIIVISTITSLIMSDSEIVMI